MAESTRDGEQIVRDYADVWSERDYARIPDVVSESYVHDGPVAVVEGHSGLEGLMREFTAAFPDFQVDVLDVLVDGDAAAAQVRYTMTHEGEFDDIAPTGRTVEMEAMGKFRLEDGKIAEHLEFHNQLDLLEQLGVTGE